MTLSDMPTFGCYNTNIMSTISLKELQSDLLGFLRRVEAGESFLVLSGEHAVAEVRPASDATVPGPRPFGLAAGQFTVPRDFDEPLPEQVISEFEGE
jgi:antitoxin (DNA-binding transcriptional repressor) of toxin-antitoxin stability system